MIVCRPSLSLYCDYRTWTNSRDTGFYYAKSTQKAATAIVLTLIILKEIVLVASTAYHQTNYPSVLTVPQSGFSGVHQTLLSQRISCGCVDDGRELSQCCGDEYSTVIKLLILIIIHHFFSVNRVGAFPGGSADWWSVICRKWHNSVIVARNHLPLLNLHCTKRIAGCTCPCIQRSCGRRFSGTNQLPLKCEIMSRGDRPLETCNAAGRLLPLVPIGGYISNSLFNTRPCSIVTCRSVSIFPQLVSFYSTAPCYLLPVTVAG